jgi:tetratricopeptide (TPR) repeat protein
MTEVDDIRVAWYWAIERGYVEIAGKFVNSFDLIADMRGWFHDMIQVFDKAITKLESQLDAGGDVQFASSEQVALLLGRMLYIQGGFYGRLGLLERAQTLCHESLTRLAELEPGNEQAWAYAAAKRRLAQIFHQQGNFAAAVPLYQEALAYFEKSGDRYTRASIMGALGLNAVYLGQYAEAERLLQQSIAIYVDIGERRAKAFFLHTLGSFVYAQAQGDYQRAEELVQESLRISQELDDRIGAGFALMHLGAVAAAAGNYAQARQLYQESLTIARQTDTRMMKLGSLDGLGAVALAVGQYEEARQWYEDSVAVSNLVGQGKQSAEALIGLGNVACALAEYAQAEHYFVQALQTSIRSVGETLDVVVGVAYLLSKVEDQEKAVELLALALYHPASMLATRDRAARLLLEMGALLPPDVLAAAKERGQAFDLEATVAELLLKLGSQKRHPEHVLDA